MRRISAQSDRLEAKENIILGRKIPAGTNSNFDQKGKYDIRDPRSYFALNTNLMNKYLKKITH